MRQHGAKRDANEPDVIDALQKVGCVVVQLSMPSLPDLLVWHPASQNLRLIEVKHARGRLTKLQTQLRERMPFTVVRSSSEAMALYGVRA